MGVFVNEEEPATVTLLLRQRWCGHFVLPNGCGLTHFLLASIRAVHVRDVANGSVPAPACLFGASGITQLKRRHSFLQLDAFIVVK